MPYITHFTVPRASLPALRALDPITTIEMTFYGSTQGKLGITQLVIDRVWIIEIKEVDQYWGNVVIADTRWGMRGRKVTCGYNLTRIRNEKQKAPIPADSSPARLSQNFRIYSKGRYLPWSVRPDGQPYTMREIVQIELAKWGLNVNYQLGDDEGSFVVENVELDNIDVYTGLAELLRRSRLQIGIMPNADLYVYSLDWYDKNLMQNLPRDFNKYDNLSPARINFSEKRNSRPNAVYVRFTKKQEVRFVATKIDNIANFEFNEVPIPLSPTLYYGQSDIDNGRVIGCQNVIQVPVPLTIGSWVFGTREVNIGEYIPMDIYLDAIGLSEDVVRTLWFSNQLETFYARKLELAAGGTISLTERVFATQIVAAIRAHYRQTYQIDPFWMDRIATVENRRVTIIDSFSGYTPPSPVFADFCTILKIRNPVVANGTGSWQENSYNWFVDESDPYRTRPIAATVSVINPQLGIFQIYPQFDTFGTVAKIIPCAVENMPKMAPFSTNPLWQAANLFPTFSAETIMSVTWRANKAGVYDSNEKYHTVSVNLGSDAGVGPPIEYLSNLEFGRYAVREYNENGTERTNPDICANLADVEAIATSEAKKIVNSYKDRITGIITIHGIFPGRLSGHMQYISYDWREGSGFSTTVDLRGAPPSPTLFETLPPSTLAIVKKQVTP